MAGILTINIKGVNPLKQRLDQMIPAEQVEETLDKGALWIEHDAKRLVRVDTGLLRASINTVSKPMSRYIGSSKNYAAAQEFGRPDLNKYGYTPYLRPAARLNRQRIINAFKELLEKK